MTTNAMSDYLELTLINHIFRGTSFTQPTNIFIALCSGVPVDANTGASTVGGSQGIAATIPDLMPHASGGTAGGYERIAAGRSNSDWDAPTSAGGDTENTGTITFATAASNWGHVSGIALCDDKWGGNVLMYGALDAVRVVNSGDVFKFNAGAIDITFA